MEKPDGERRQTLRIPVSLDARWKGISGRHTGRVSNLSLIGCYFESSGHVLNRETLEVEIRMPDGEWVALTGEVVFRTQESGFGFYFTGMSEQVREALKRIAAHYAPDTHEPSV